jgi:molybdopterin adenylyltransferase
MGGPAGEAARQELGRRYNRAMSSHGHRAAAPREVRCAILTVSDTRTEATDTSGQSLVTLLEEAGHHVVARRLVRDEPADVRAIVDAWLDDEAVQAVITTGGTGIGRRDSTYEALVGLLDKRLDGFGELFRMLSYEEIGAAAMLSRACAGVARGRVLVLLPGSEHAVRLATTKLILPELGHMLREITR